MLRSRLSMGGKTARNSWLLAAVFSVNSPLVCPCPQIASRFSASVAHTIIPSPVRAASDSLLPRMMQLRCLLCDETAAYSHANIKDPPNGCDSMNIL
jgi:hypothetical protein